MHCGAEVTESSTNKQHHLHLQPCSTRFLPGHVYPHSVSSTQPATAQHSPLFDWSIQLQVGSLTQEGSLVLCALPIGRCGRVRQVRQLVVLVVGLVRCPPFSLVKLGISRWTARTPCSIYFWFPKSMEYWLQLYLVYCNTKDKPLQTGCKWKQERSSTFWRYSNFPNFGRSRATGDQSLKWGREARHYTLASPRRLF
jgi:hypothetical protein